MPSLAVSRRLGTWKASSTRFAGRAILLLRWDSTDGTIRSVVMIIVIVSDMLGEAQFAGQRVINCSGMQLGLLVKLKDPISTQEACTGRLTRPILVLARQAASESLSPATNRARAPNASGDPTAAARCGNGTLNFERDGKHTLSTPTLLVGEAAHHEAYPDVAMQHSSPAHCRELLPAVFRYWGRPHTHIHHHNFELCLDACPRISENRGRSGHHGSPPDSLSLSRNIDLDSVMPLMPASSGSAPVKPVLLSKIDLTHSPRPLRFASLPFLLIISLSIYAQHGYFLVALAAPGRELSGTPLSSQIIPVLWIEREDSTCPDAHRITHLA